MYQVFAFYPSLGIKVRVTEYKSKSEAFEYCGALRLCDTPYLMHKNGKVIDIATYDLTREQMAEMIEKYL